MGDVKLTPQETSRLLTHLDEGMRQVVDAREEIIQAMARRTKAPAEDTARNPPRSRKKR